MLDHSRRSSVTTSIPPVWAVKTVTGGVSCSEVDPQLACSSTMRQSSFLLPWVLMTFGFRAGHKKKTLGVNYADEHKDEHVQAGSGRAEAVGWRQQHPLRCPEDQGDGCGFSCPSMWLEQLWNPADLRWRRLQRLLWIEECQQVQPTASRRVVPHQMQGQSPLCPPSQQPPCPQTGHSSALWKEMVKSCTSTTLMFRDVADSLHRTVLNMRVWKGLHPAFIAFEEQKTSSLLSHQKETPSRALVKSLLLLYHVN